MPLFSASLSEALRIAKRTMMETGLIRLVDNEMAPVEGLDILQTQKAVEISTAYNTLAYLHTLATND